ncbi:serine/arginine-rich splicing factor 3 isoform X3 [Hydra vulgaris]|uniref:serine/arginine-rich splicing factor 3 isoform X3 n=1 Tax=Hydra vulgaris TaxID=6087 RepID=UPI00019251A6|nr:serine/arginine-rich splicing factor 3 isoform X2 [Hydra vulgaris]
MSRIFIGGLPDDASRTELEREFEHFGSMREVWVARNPPGFGFIVFDDPRDAEDAIREMDGRRVCGMRVRVEKARGPNSNNRNRSSAQNEKCYNCGKIGHLSRDCRSRPAERGYSRRRSRSGSRNRRRQRSYSRSRSKERSRRSRSGSKDHKRTQSPEKRRSASQDDTFNKKSPKQKNSKDWANSSTEVDYNEKIYFESDEESSSKA